MTAPSKATADHPSTEWSASSVAENFRLRRSGLRGRPARIGLAILLLAVLVSVFAPMIVSLFGLPRPGLQSSRVLDAFGNPTGPSVRHWLGVDPLGRDVLSRLLYGGRASLIASFGAIAISLVIGVVVGMVAGYNGGVVDEVLSRLTDVALCFPVLLLALGLAAACSTDAGCLAGTVHPGVLLVTLVMGLSGWPYLARLVRDQTREVRERDFVLAAHALGSRSTRILLRHVFPNLLSPVVVFVAYALPGNLLYEASLAFLGVGVPLSTPTWGNMLADSIDTATTAWWYFLAPTVAIAATAVGFNLVAEGFRKVVDAGRR